VSTKRKVRLTQAAFGAVVLTLMMQPIGILGYGSYIWMLFMPLLLFFAFGAQFEIIPSMIVSYGCGVLWALVNGLASGVIGKFLPEIVTNIVTPVLVIFCILTVHENLLEKTIFGNIPALFMGLASTFFIFLLKPANAPVITPIHLIAFFLYGIILSVMLAAGGFLVCSLIFGKEKTEAVFAGKE
jgi:hypothetical protein